MEVTEEAYEYLVQHQNLIKHIEDFEEWLDLVEDAKHNSNINNKPLFL